MYDVWREEALKKLGEEGWELVTVTSSTDVAPEYYFKREKKW